MKITLRPCSNRVTADPAWLGPVRRALDSAPERVVCFFRDDDAGWDRPRLRRLLDLFDALGLPLDLAVIPAALDAGTAYELWRRLDRADVGVHQHGYAHANHEPVGERKCEFGPARGRTDQLRDVEAGRELLARRFGSAVEPIFTPPWNRCTRVTGECLVELGFETLSREARADRLGLPRLRELPVSVDWCKRRGGSRVPRPAIARLAADAIGSGGPLGLMFHHAEMDAADLETAADLLALLAGHERVRCTRMRSAVNAATT